MNNFWSNLILNFKYRSKHFKIFQKLDDSQILINKFSNLNYMKRVLKKMTYNYEINFFFFFYNFDFLHRSYNHF